MILMIYFGIGIFITWVRIIQLIVLKYRYNIAPKQKWFWVVMVDALTIIFVWPITIVNLLMIFTNQAYNNSASKLANDWFEEES